MEKVTIFTDGAAKGNPGPGGYGVVINFGDRVVELGEAKAMTTNNEMELQAVVVALQYLSAEVKSVEIYTDSKYVVEGATGWVFGWMKNGWLTKTKEPVKNQELWQSLVAELKKVNVIWQKVPGHVGIIGNERADKIASDLGEGKPVVLFNGARSDYKYEIENVDYDKQKATDRSEARKRQAQKAYSYVSQVDGEIQVHKTWAECEARVKGKQGVKFKKSLSAEDEQSIIKDFS